MTDSKVVTVVAIDFGTCFTGYAFSLNETCDKIQFPTSGLKVREPTTVLLNKDKCFDCFGHKAQSKYAKLAAKNKHQDWFYVQNFKMKLYLTRRLTRDAVIHDNQGRSLSAISIFQMVIGHIKEQAEKYLKDTMSGLQDCYIKWILTVPAIWSDSAKQFMREAAKMAGIEDNQLSLVLEPEAASLCCKETPLCVVAKLDGVVQSEAFPEGHKYILADLGGGTADICVHEILNGGNLREIHRSDGGAFGGINVDLAFQDFLIKLIGAPAWMRFKTECMEEYLELMNDFETNKREFTRETQDEDNEIKLRIPTCLLEIVQDVLHMSLGDIIPNTTYVNRLTLKYEKLILDRSVMEDFFQPTADGIVKCLTNIILEINKDDTNIGTLLLVGGFSQSPYLRETIKLEIKGVKTICPVDGSLAILKGAVMMGYNSSIIVERRMRYTYGFRVVTPFREGTDPEAFKEIWEGESYCNKTFRKIITKGDVVFSGQIFTHKTNTPAKLKESKHITLCTRFYKSTSADPIYCTEEGCELVGMLDMYPPKEGWPDRLTVNKRLRVEGSEINCTAVDSNKATYDVKWDCL